jgi:hypothetical protein
MPAGYIDLVGGSNPFGHSLDPTVVAAILEAEVGYSRTIKRPVEALPDDPVGVPDLKMPGKPPMPKPWV